VGSAIMGAKNAHHPLGASGAPRWIRCTGSVRLALAIPEKGSTHSADIGTLAHEGAARTLVSALEHVRRGANAPLPSHHEALHLLPEEAIPASLDPEMRDAIREYVLGCRDPGWIGRALEAEPGTEVRLVAEWVELPVDLPIIQDIEQVGSTADHVAVWAMLRPSGQDLYALVVTDLKYGVGVPVQAQGNEQVRLYLGGALRQVEVYYPIDVVIGVVHQVRLGPKSHEVLSLAELQAFLDMADEKARQALTDNAPLVPGEKQCRFCPAKAECPALAEFVRAAVAADFERADRLQDEGRTAWSAADVQRYSVEELGAAKGYVGLVQMWANAVNDEVRDLLIEGVEIPGWRLAEGRSIRCWTSQDLAEAALVTAGLSNSDIWQSTLISPAKAEAALGKKRFSTLVPLVNKPHGPPTVVPEDDPRKPYSRVATAADFDSD
jgi:hypothetical protein